MTTKNLIATLVVLGITTPALAQQPLKVPEPSPAATIGQTVGLTKIEISYHRPAVNKRKVFGELVPYGQVWRAGANENTTITFSSPVKIEGHALAAGTYGVQMLPVSAKQFTVIFSNTSTAWGHYGYDQKEDALRVNVTPQPSEFEERLSYHFDNPTEQATTVSLHWDKLKIPFNVSIDTPAVVMAAMRSDLRGVNQFNPQAWLQAAAYWAQHGGDLDEAQKFVDRGKAGGPDNFQTYRVAGLIAEKRGDTAKANELRDKAMTVGTEADLNNLGYTLLFAKKVDEAIGVFKRNVQEHPQSWNAYDSLGEAYMAKNDKQNAAELYGKALTLVKDEPNKKRIEATLTRLKNK